MLMVVFIFIIARPIMLRFWPHWDPALPSKHRLPLGYRPWRAQISGGYGGGGDVRVAPRELVWRLGSGMGLTMAASMDSGSFQRALALL